MFTNDEKQLIDRLSAVADLYDTLQSLAYRSDENLAEIKTIEDNLARVIAEKTQGFPWLVDAIAQYHQYRDLKIADFLKWKLRPAVSSAERVREIAAEKRLLLRQLRVTRNLIRYYEALFPWLVDFVGEDVDELIEQTGELVRSKASSDDPVKFYVTCGEYQELSTTERNQRALDRFWQKKKTPWQIGRDYERYVGYLYEQRGYRVRYQGIVAGLEDLGRDLIAERDGAVEIIQCKYWAQHKTIHEKHINQLFGTTVEYWVKNCGGGDRQLSLFPDVLQSQKIVPCFVTSTKLSETAREFASVLGVKVQENFAFEAYPCIKCNVSRTDSEKIYHLPFDQQYDTTVIEPERGERYVETVEQAESLGFRRAFRWKGSTN